MKMKMIRLARGTRAGWGVPECELATGGANRDAADAGFAASAWSATEAKPQPADCNSCLRLVQCVAGTSDAGMTGTLSCERSGRDKVMVGHRPAGAEYILQDHCRLLKQNQGSVSEDDRFAHQIHDPSPVVTENEENVSEHENQSQEWNDPCEAWNDFPEE